MPQESEEGIFPYPAMRDRLWGGLGIDPFSMSQEVSTCPTGHSGGEVVVVSGKEPL